MTTARRAAWVAALTCGAAAAVPPAGQAAEILYGVTDQNRIVRFASDGPGDVPDTVQVSGLLQADERIVGIDVRPATDQLYAVTNRNRVYSVNPVSGNARPAINPIETPLNGTLFGVDFNPVSDALRIVSDADQNLRVRFSDDNPRTFNEGTLAYAAGDAGAGTNPAVTGAAYSNNLPGATSTTLLDIDVTRDALVRQDPPAAGTLATIGALGVDAADVAGFDVASSGAAFAAIIRTGQQVPELYRIDLGNGRATPAATSAAIVLPQGSGALRGLATGGATGDDRTPPDLSIAFSSTILEENTATLEPSASCDESCTVTISARVQGRSAGSATEAITGGPGRETIEVRLNQTARTRIARSGTELIELSIAAVDAAGNRNTQNRQSRTQTLAARRGGG